MSTLRTKSAIYSFVVLSAVIAIHAAIFIAYISA